MLLPPAAIATTPVLRRSRSHDATIVMSLVISRLDYCNAVLAGLPASTVAPLQRAQNAAARRVLSGGSRKKIFGGPGPFRGA